MVIFSLFVAFTGTFAWFISVKNTNYGSTDFTVESKSGKFKQVTFHTLEKKLIGNSYADSSFDFSKDYIGKITYNWETKQVTKTGITNIALDGYDYLDHERPLLLLFELDKQYTSAQPVTITATTNDGSDCYLGKRNADGEHEYELDDSDIIVTTRNDVNYYGLSSVINFYTRDFSTASFGSTFGQFYDEEPESDIETNVASALSISTPVWDQDQNLWTITIDANRSASEAITYYGGLADGISGFDPVFNPQAISTQQFPSGFEAVYASSTGFVKLITTPVTNSTSTMKVIVGLGSPFYGYNNLTSGKSFVDFYVEDDVEQSRFNQTIDPVYASTGDVQYIAVIVDYYSDAIEYIYSSFLGDPILESYDSVLHFICDWTMEVL